MSSVKILLKQNGLVLSDEELKACHDYQQQVGGMLASYRVDYATVCLIVETLLEAGRLMGAQQAVRRHDEHEQQQVAKVKEFIEANRKITKDMKN